MSIDRRYESAMHYLEQYESLPHELKRIVDLVWNGEGEPPFCSLDDGMGNPDAEWVSTNYTLNLGMYDDEAPERKFGGWFMVGGDVRSGNEYSFDVANADGLSEEKLQLLREARRKIQEERGDTKLLRYWKQEWDRREVAKTDGVIDVLGGGAL